MLYRILQICNGKYREMKQSDLILNRLKGVLDCRSDTALAVRLGVPTSTLGTWRSRDSFPYTIAVQLAEELGLSLDWVLAGIGKPYRQPKEQYAVGEPAASYGEDLSPRQQNLLTLFEALDEGAQREILAVAEEKKRLRDLETKLQEMDERLKHLG